jgi:hypothetical protein
VHLDTVAPLEVRLTRRLADGEEEGEA